MAKYGYVRVSTKEQKTDRQMEAMLEYGVDVKNIFTDKLSGKDFNRPSYHKMIKKLKAGDLLVIKSIDRLGRDYKEILEEWRKIVRKKEVDIEVIDLPILNTTQEIDGTAGVLIADILLRLLAYVSQTEREFIKQRQAEGIAIALSKQGEARLIANIMDNIPGWKRVSSHDFFDYGKQRGWVREGAPLEVTDPDGFMPVPEQMEIPFTRQDKPIN